ncbi:efflux RND transporter periplasmic adaptor subunit [Oceanospirillum sediminis]|uniref:Efflux RND transporter periplasmic adaptor subunit n=1 Tax=Oceanospirillum sediminis TaxID=2760088 RepID=A0A839IMJ2_9GAMM|nr:efflux RND transporter periplasmic adaptor subunit [Oceanospirillum sediminis]MBB1486633.1 efflux RND transporter periplasmic adaptor subunit [Oceanospirillum sediminis]
MKKLLSFAWLSGVLMLSSGTIALAAEKPQMPPMPVEAQIVQPEDLVRKIELVGSLSANESVMISPEVSGRIAQIHFAEGQSVKAGDLLFSMDSSVQRAELKQAQARQGLSQQEYKRASELLSTNAGSVNTRDNNLAQLRIDQAGVDLAKERLAKMTLSAPFDGIVGLREVSDGEYVTPGQGLVSLVSVNPIRLEFRVPEIYLSGISLNQSVNVKFDALPGETVTGKVFAISPEVDLNGRNVKVLATLPNENGRLRPGLFARVSLQLETIKDALMVKEEALVPQGNAQLIYTLVDGKVNIAPATLGLRERGRVQVVQGVKAGDIVVTAGQMKLRPGAAAAPVNLPKAQ